MRGLIRRTPECALHVHVGVPDPAAAVAVLNGLREALPLLHGLGAASPFWFGLDSGMASSRAAVIRAYPGRGVPPALNALGPLPGDPRRDPCRRAARRTRRWSGGTRGRSRGSARSSCGRSTSNRTSTAAAGIAALARGAGRPRGRVAAARPSAGARPALVQLPRRARRAGRRRSFIGAGCGRCARPRGRSSESSAARIRRSRASSAFSPTAAGQTGSAPRMRAAACRAC